MRNDDHGGTANEDEEGGIVETTSKAVGIQDEDRYHDDDFVQTSKNEDEKNDNDEDESAGNVPDEIEVAMLELAQPMAIDDETIRPLPSDCDRSGTRLFARSTPSSDAELHETKGPLTI